VKKNYQKNATRATTPVLPEAVSVAMAELAADVQGSLTRFCGLVCPQFHGLAGEVTAGCRGWVIS